MPRVKVDIVPGGFLALAANRIGGRWRLWRTLAAVVDFAQNDAKRSAYDLAAVRAWIVRERLDLTPEDVYTVSVGISRLARAAHLSESTTKRHLSELLNLGVLLAIKQPGKNRATVYALEYPGMKDE